MRANRTAIIPIYAGRQQSTSSRRMKDYEHEKRMEVDSDYKRFCDKENRNEAFFIVGVIIWVLAAIFFFGLDCDYDTSRGQKYLKAISGIVFVLPLFALIVWLIISMF